MIFELKTIRTMCNGLSNILFTKNGPFPNEKHYIKYKHNII